MRRRLLVPFIAALLLLAGCGASGGDAASSDGAATDGSSSASTTEADGGEPGDEGDPGTSGKVTTEELEALFPEASEIGPEFSAPEIEYADEADDEAEEEDETDAAMREQCPKAAELDFLDAPSLSADEVSAKYTTEKDQEIGITLNPTTGPITEENLGKIIEAWNDCGIVTIEDEDSGTMKMDLGAEELDGIGDYGASISMEAEFELFGQPLTLDFKGYLFVVNGVAVSITAASGLDDSMTASPAPEELLEPVAKLMEERVASITD